MGAQVKTPRFYVDMPTFLHATGDTRWGYSGYDYHGGVKLLYANPSSPHTINSDANGSALGIGIIGASESTHGPTKTAFPINFCGLLNHNLGDKGEFVFIGKTNTEIDEDGDPFVPQIKPTIPTGGEVLNLSNGSAADHLKATWNGTSIFTFEEMVEYWNTFHIYQGTPQASKLFQIGSLMVGKYWDAPYNPDLNLTMSRRFDGIKKQKTVGGKMLANIYYDGPTEWTMYRNSSDIYKYPPFELDTPSAITDTTTYNQRAKSGLGRKGLRSWKLNFSYISEDNMWSAYESSSHAPFTPQATGFDSITNTDIPQDDGTDVSNYYNPMLQDDSFNFVWNATLGGTLPFIFQPDNTNNNPDQFAICTFKNKTLNVKQVAHNVYSIGITIDEVA